MRCEWDVDDDCVGVVELCGSNYEQSQGKHPPPSRYPHPSTHLIHISSTSHPHPIHISFTSHPHLIHISSTSHSHLILITSTSHPHLISISSTSHPHLISLAAFQGDLKCCEMLVSYGALSFTSHPYHITSTSHPFFLWYYRLSFSLFL